MTTIDSRPGGVTLIATLCAVFGLLELLAGILSLIFLPALVDQSGLGESTVLWSAVALILLGFAYLLVSSGLYRGRDLARVVVLLVSFVHAMNGLWLSFAGQLAAGLFTIVVALVVVALLFTGPGAKYFARSTLEGGAAPEL